MDNGIFETRLYALAVALSDSPMTAVYSCICVQLDGWMLSAFSQAFSPVLRLCRSHPVRLVLNDFLDSTLEER